MNQYPKCKGLTVSFIVKLSKYGGILYKHSWGKRVDKPTLSYMDPGAVSKEEPSNKKSSTSLATVNRQYPPLNKNTRNGKSMLKMIPAGLEYCMSKPFPPQTI